MSSTRTSATELRSAAAGLAPSSSFAPVARRDARLLILGSLPGQRSLREQQYYAHPQNAFWRIMAVLAGAQGAYEQRCAALLERRIALWDVLAESLRPGSMDADICMDSARPNDFSEFFAAHPAIERVCFNGRKAQQMFARFVGEDRLGRPIEFRLLPSTSPAYAAMGFDEKLDCWRTALALD